MKRIFIVLFILLLTLGSAFAQETPQDEAVETPVETTQETEIYPPPPSHLQTPPAFNEDIRNYKSFPYSLGAGIEYGLNSRDNYALGYSATIDWYIFNPYTALVLRGTMYNDFRTITATEAEIAFRLYFIDAWGGAFFAQLGFGGSSYREEERQINTYIMDFTAGYRWYIQETFLRGFYIEPFARLAYPLEWGAGLFIGHWFAF
jgi:hypothetical protein